MRIVNIFINGFGIYNNLEIKELSPGLNIFEGPNEIGKSTLMAFFRSVLFGFTDRRSNDNRYQPVNGGQHGGKLTIKNSKGLHYTVERVPGGSAGRVSVYLPDHSLAGENVLQEILGGISRILYRNVFAFGLEELQRLETLQHDEVSSYIYSAGMGVGTVSLAEVEKNLKSKANVLFKTGGQRPKINTILNKLEDTQAKICKLQEIPQEYNRLKKEIEDVEEILEKNREKLEQVQRLIIWTEKAVRARDSYIRLLQVKELLLALPKVENFPEDGVERLQILVEKYGDINGELEEKELHLKEMQKVLEKITINNNLLLQNVEIDVLLEGRSLIIAHLNNLSDLQSAVDVTAKEVERCLKLLGAEWSKEQVQGFDYSVIVRDQIRVFKERFREGSERLKEAQLKFMEVRRLKEKSKVEFDGAFRAVKECRISLALTSEPFKVREKALARFRSIQSELKELEQNLKHFIERKNDVKEQQESLKAKEKSPDLRIQTWLLVYMFLFCSVLGGYYYFKGQVDDLLMMLLSLLFGTTLIFGICFYKKRKILKQSINKDLLILQNKYADLEKQCLSLQMDTERLSKEMKLSANTFIGKGEPNSEEINAAARKLETEKEAIFQKSHFEKILASKEKEVRQAKELLARSQQELLLIQEEMGSLRAEWNKYLESLGFNKELSPDGVEELIQIIKKSQGAICEHSKAMQNLRKEKSEIEKYLFRLNQVLVFCGDLEVKPEEAPAAVLKLKNKLTEARRAKEEKDSLTREIHSLRQEIRNLKIKIEKLRGEKEVLLTAGNAANPEEFRKRAAWNEERKRLLKEKEQLQNTLTAIAGSEERYRELENDLRSKDGDETQKTLTKLREDYNELEHIIRDTADKKGRLSQKIADLEKNDELADLMLTREVLQSELSELAREWGVNRICKKLLDLARERYEQERQPSVLKKASGYFNTFTGGKYRRVFIPLEKSHPEVEREDLTRLKTTELSRGTAEQLYLAMRFALVREYAERVASLPVIMDDILVNFDPNRLQSAVKVICALARKHQILFFTCHPHVAQMLVEQSSESKYINLSSYI